MPDQIRAWLNSGAGIGLVVAVLGFLLMMNVGLVVFIYQSDAVADSSDRQRIRQRIVDEIARVDRDATAVRAELKELKAHIAIVEERQREGSLRFIERLSRMEQEINHRSRSQ